MAGNTWGFPVFFLKDIFTPQKKHPMTLCGTEVSTSCPAWVQDVGDFPDSGLVCGA